MAKKDLTTNEEQTNKTEENVKTVNDKLGLFINKNKIVLIFVTVIAVVLVAVFSIVLNIKNSNTSKAIENIEAIEYTLFNNSKDATKEEIDALYTTTLNSIEQYCSKNGVAGARALLLKADICFRKADFTQAKDCYLQAASKVKGSYLQGVCYFNAAVSLEELNDSKKALEYYDLAVKDKNFLDVSRANFAIGRIKESLGDYNGAKEAYEQITSSNNSQDAFANLAQSRILTLQIEGKIN